MRTWIRLVGLLAAMALFAAACGDDDGEDATLGVEEAQEQFCDDAQDYVTALDRYGRLFADSAVTVGDVRASGEELIAQRDAVEAAASDLRAANEAAIAEDGESTATTVSVSDESLERVDDAEAAFSDAVEGVDDDTPLAEASVEVSSAAFQLQIAWLLLLAEAGCIDDLDESVTAVVEYVTALQTDLTTAGFYTGPIDGIYGPETIEAVQALQEQVGLPTTGLMDRPTQAALAELLGDQESAQVAALQGLLAGVGYWDGPIDGVWSEELGDALARLQADLGLEPTGTMDPTTLQALQAALAVGIAPPSGDGATTTAPPTGDTTTTTVAPGEEAADDTVLDLLVADGRFETLLAAIDAAGLGDALSGEGLVTVFAPTDDAFAALPPGTLDALLADPAALEALLLGHVVSGAAILAEFAVAVGTLPTAGGGSVTVTTVDDDVLVGGAAVLTADLLASNGVVHAIDAVLEP